MKLKCRFHCELTWKNYVAYYLFTGAHKVQCSEDLMKVDIILSEDNIDPSNIYLEGMKGYPNPKCQPTVKDHIAQFQLPLRDFYECGVTRIVYKMNVSVSMCCVRFV